MQRWLSMQTLAILLTAISAACPAIGQKPPEQEHQVKIFSLEYADAKSAAHVLDEVIGENMMIAVDPGSNSVVLSGPADKIETASTLISQLDLRPANTHAQQTAYFQTPDSVSVEFVRAVDTIISNQARTAAVGNTLVVRGTSADMDKVEDLIRAAWGDRIESLLHARGMQVEFFFIAARLSDETDTSASDALPITQPLSPELQAVGKSLAANGFRRPELLAPLVVHVGRNQAQFELRGSVSDDMQVEVNGTTALGPLTEYVELQVSANIGGLIRVEGERTDYRKVFELETTVTAPFGDYVVLAASPSKADAVEAIALVVRVTPLAK